MDDKFINQKEESIEVDAQVEENDNKNNEKNNVLEIKDGENNILDFPSLININEEKEKEETNIELNMPKEEKVNKTEENNIFNENINISTDKNNLNDGNNEKSKPNKEIKSPKLGNDYKGEAEVKSPKENQNVEENPEKYDIDLESEYLFLNCPQCKKIPRISFKNDNPAEILIECGHCCDSWVLDMPNYIKGLSNINPLQKNKCLVHDSFLDKYCFKCCIQYCNKCETKKIHSDHSVASVKKLFSSEIIKKGKIKIDNCKKELKNYIITFLKEKINKYPKNMHSFLKNYLIESYFADMKIFFQFADNILLNYDVEYPDFIQQLNLQKFLSYLNKKVSLLELNEPPKSEGSVDAKDGAIEWVKLIFNFSDNNFFNKKEYKKLILKDFTDNFEYEILKSILIDDERIVIAFKQDLKVYNYKHKNFISTLTNIYKPNSKIQLSQIFKDLIAVISYISDYCSILKIFSINSANKILFEKSFNYKIKDVKKINNNSFGILLNDSIEIYKSSESFQEILNSLSLNGNYKLNFEMVSEINGVKDFVGLSHQPYLVSLCSFEIIVFNQEFKIHKEIKVKNISMFNSISELNDDNLILGGYYIGILNNKNWTFSIIQNDHIPEKKKSYLTETHTYINYSQFNLTYSNKFICKKKFRQIHYISYEDAEDEVHEEENVCIFDYNPKKRKISLIQTIKNLKVDDIFANEKGKLLQQKKIIFIIYNNFIQ